MATGCSKEVSGVCIVYWVCLEIFKVSLRDMFSYQAIVLSSVMSIVHCQGHQKSWKLKENTKIITFHIVALFFFSFCKRSSWQVGTNCQGNGLEVAQSFHFPKAFCSFLRQPPALPSLALGILCFLLKDVSFSFLVSPACSHCSYALALPALPSFSWILSFSSLKIEPFGFKTIILDFSSFVLMLLLRTLLSFILIP